MRYLKKFFESTQSLKLTQEDFEDEFLELLDMGYEMSEFAIGYYNNKEGSFQRVPKNGYHPAYYMWLNIIDESEYDDDDYNPEKPTLSEINQNVQNDYQKANKVLSILSSAQKRLGVEFYMDWTHEKSFGFYVVPKEAKPLEVSEKEANFYVFSNKVFKQVSSTLNNGSDFTLENETEHFIVRIKFNPSVTTSRITTAIRNIDYLKTGIKRNMRMRTDTYNFTATKLGPRELVIQFESKKNSRF